jgi:uncharacterized coiled-coil protein SlyX
MFSWLLKLGKRKCKSVAVQNGTRIELGGETFLFERLPPGQAGEPFRRVNARLCEMKTLLARQETTITVQQETIVELNTKIRALEQQADAQTILVDRYGDLLGKMPGLVAAFISNQSKEVPQIKAVAQSAIDPDQPSHLESS